MIAQIAAWAQNASIEEVNTVIDGLKSTLRTRNIFDKSAEIKRIQESDEHEDFEGTWLQYLGEYTDRRMIELDSGGIGPDDYTSSPYCFDVTEDVGDQTCWTVYKSSHGDFAYMSMTGNHPDSEDDDAPKRVWRVKKKEFFFCI